MNTHLITTERLTLARVEEVLTGNYKLALSDEAKQNINKCRQYLDNKMANHDGPIYGINTGFGSLCNHSISKEDLSTLQENLVMSHACGTGDEVPTDIVKLMMFFKIQATSQGNSGVQLATVERLVEFYNNDIIPIVYQQGSLGASGDLSPLAHMCLPLIGKGDVHFEGKKVDASVVYDKFGWEPIKLQSKEGLALLNGTQFMSSFGVYTVLKALRLSKMADVMGAISLDAFDGRIEPFHPNIQTIRPHQGQITTAARIKSLLQGSEIIVREKAHVQDPYSFRCMPQVHGASKDSIHYVASVLETEINSVTDNPTIFPDEDLIISAGNFHGQPLALALDYLAMAMAELGNISERRTYQMIGGKRGLPSFLVAKPGLNSGFMIPQYAAASIVSQSKQYCSPASVDSIESSQGQEDHVSMGANAATKALKVADNLERVLAIEMFNSTQALEFRRPLKSSQVLEKIVAEYRKSVPFVDNDIIMYKGIHNSIEAIKKMDLSGIE